MRRLPLDPWWLVAPILLAFAGMVAVLSGGGPQILFWACLAVIVGTALLGFDRWTRRHHPERLRSRR